MPPQGQGKQLSREIAAPGDFRYKWCIPQTYIKIIEVCGACMSVVHQLPHPYRYPPQVCALPSESKQVGGSMQTAAMMPSRAFSAALCIAPQSAVCGQQRVWVWFISPLAPCCVADCEPNTRCCGWQVFGRQLHQFLSPARSGWPLHTLFLSSTFWMLFIFLYVLIASFRPSKQNPFFSRFLISPHFVH